MDIVIYSRVEPVCPELGLTIYHDLLSPGEIRYMKTAGSLAAATVVDRNNTQGGSRRLSNERTQSSGWLYDQVGGASFSSRNSSSIHNLKN